MAGIASSFGVSAGNPNSAPATQSALDTFCLGKTVVAKGTLDDVNSVADVAMNFGHGDYLEIGNMLNDPIADPTAIGAHRICGGIWNAINAIDSHTTICSRDTPFRVGVKFDSDEALADAPGNGNGNVENEINADANGAGVGYTGFWLDYWQKSC